MRCASLLETVTEKSAKPVMLPAQNLNFTKYPTLRGGKRLFANGTIPAAFKVTESTVTSKGVILLKYECAGVLPTRKGINLRRIAGVTLSAAEGESPQPKS